MNFIKKHSNLFNSLVSLVVLIQIIKSAIQKDYQSTALYVIVYVLLGLLAVYIDKETRHKKEIEKLKNEQ